MLSRVVAEVFGDGKSDPLGERALPAAADPTWAQRLRVNAAWAKGGKSAMGSTFTIRTAWVGLSKRARGARRYDHGASGGMGSAWVDDLMARENQTGLREGSEMLQGFGPPAPRPRDLQTGKAALKALPAAERRDILTAISGGRRVDDARHAALAATLAAGQQAQARRWVWWSPLFAAAISAVSWFLDRGGDDPLPIGGVVAVGIIGSVFVAGIFAWQARRARASQVLNEDLAAAVPEGSAALLDPRTGEIVRSGATQVPGARLYQASAALLLLAAAVNLIDFPMPAGLLSLFTPLVVFLFALHEVRDKPGRAGVVLFVIHALGIAHFAGLGVTAVGIIGAVATGCGAVLAATALFVSREYRRSRRLERRRVEALGGPQRFWSWYRSRPRWLQIVIGLLAVPPAAFILSAFAVGVVEAILDSEPSRP